jgi:prefoldin subunit 5
MESIKLYTQKEIDSRLNILISKENHLKEKRQTINSELKEIRETKEDLGSISLKQFKLF